MKRTFCGILVLAMLLASLASCSGYNRVMREHLKNADNYQAREMILKDFYYIDPSTQEKKRDFADQAFGDNDIIFEVAFGKSVEELILFSGHTFEEDAELELYQFQLRVIPSNSQILLENGFFDRIAVDEKISFKASDYIYMDSEYFYIAQLEYADTEYLSFDDGLKNIVDMMEENKSIF